MKNFAAKGCSALLRISFLSVMALAGMLHYPAYSQEYSPISRLGTNEALCQGGIQTEAELQAFYASNPELVSQVLANAAWPGDKRDLDAVMAAGGFVEKEYAPGSRFHWIGANRKNTGVALPLREWAGKESFVGYEIKVTSQCQVFTMVIPKICCNLSLMSFEPEPVPQPLVSTSVSADLLTVCTEPGTSVEVIAEDGARTDAGLDANGCWTGALPAGNYLVRATNNHCSGAVSTSDVSIAAAEPEPVEEVVQEPEADTFIPYISGFVGREARERFNFNEGAVVKDSSKMVGFKVGALYPLNEKYSLFGQIGGYKLLSLNDGTLWSDRGAFLDAGLEVNLTESGFMGIGISWWNADQGDSSIEDLALLFYGGGDIGEDTNTQWYLEGRIFEDDTDQISDNNMLTVGLRYLFQ